MKHVKVTARILEPLDTKKLREEKGAALEPRKDVMKVIRERMEASLR